MGSMIGMLRSKKTQEKSSTGQSLFGCESSLSCPVMDIMFNPHKAENMWSTKTNLLTDMYKKLQD